MVHCYCMLLIFKEAKEDFAKIVGHFEKMRSETVRVMIENTEGRAMERKEAIRGAYRMTGGKQFL